MYVTCLDCSSRLLISMTLPFCELLQRNGLHVFPFLVTELQHLQSGDPRRRRRCGRRLRGRPAAGQEKELRRSPEERHPV